MNAQQVLSPEQIAQYKAQGYTDQDLQEAVNQISKENGGSALQQSYQQVMQQRATDPRQHASNSFFQTQKDDNLIKWQLELDSILERVEHLLRGDKPTFVKGNLIWKSPKDNKDRTLNDFGVSEIMKILSMYLNRNTILSNYDEETINFKVYDFGMEIADLFYLKYEAMGLITLEKRKLYPMIIRMIVDVVHSSYLRALHGGERESLGTARQITQTEPLTHGVNVNLGGYGGTGERGLLNPMRYVKGRFK